MKKQCVAGLIFATMLFFVACDIPSPVKQISGVVVEVKYIVSAGSWGASDIKGTVVEFDDGRVKVFNNIVDEVIQKGKTNVVSYDEWNRIVAIEIIKQ